MSVPLTIRGTTYLYPEVGTSPAEQWGEEATAWAEAVTESLNDLISETDILETTSPINNNVTSATNVNQLSFDASLVREAVVEFVIRRVLNTTELVEEGTLRLVYQDNTAIWNYSQLSTNDNSGVNLTVNSSGQVQYTSTNMGAGTYTGTITFRAKTLKKP